MRKTTERLPCEMTMEEKLECAERLASTLRHIESVEISHKIACDNYKDTMKTAQSEIDNLSQELRTGETFKDVQVVHDYDFDLKVMRVTRTDTGEVIRTRPLTPEELQQRIPGMEEEQENAGPEAAPEKGK